MLVRVRLACGMRSASRAPAAPERPATSPMSRWLVTGSAGMLGQDLAAVLAGAGHEVTAGPPRRAGRHRPRGLPRGAVRGHDVVVNAAAWTAVDDAET